MNDKERSIMNKIVEAHSEFIQLEQTHPSDIKEWVEKRPSSLLINVENLLQNY
jgi:hypothetical protein